ncbi:MAG: hypothetical protein AB8F34_00595 [Akkermansiaceae bacterium]
MKQPLLIHSIWAIVAIVAFAVGSKQFSEKSASALESPDDESRPGARYSERSSSGKTGSESKRRGRERGQADSSIAELGKSSQVRLTAKNIEALGKMIKESRDPIERRHAFSELLKGLTAENAMLVREQIEHMSSKTSEWKEFHYAWGALAGEVSVNFGAESKKTDMAACFSGWASADPDAALAWLNGQPDDRKERGDLKWGAVYGLANKDPELATNFVSERLKLLDKDAGRMINLVAESVLRSGDPVEAARWSESLPKGVLRDVAVSRVARDYAADDPVKAVSWLETLPEGNGQTKGMGVAFSSWANRDASAAADRLNGMADSPLRDSAVSGFSRRIVHSDTAAALDWAGTISNEKVRNDTLVSYARIYMHRDREAAKQWLANSNLTPELQKKVRTSGKRR